MERHLTGKETEPWEMLYFKIYKSQLAVIEQALETASLMLGGQKARGHCLEMICADFLAGASLDVSGNADSLLLALSRIYLLLPNSQQQEFLLGYRRLHEIRLPKQPRLRLTRIRIGSCVSRSSNAMAGAANDAEVPKICRSITFSRVAFWEAMRMKISSPCAVYAIGNSMATAQTSQYSVG